MSSLADAIECCPHLASPAALARVDTGGKFLLPKHLDKLNRELMEAWATPDSRLAVNMPFQHGKSWLSSHYFPAWVLLLWPETRIALGSFEEGFSGTFGGKVRAVLERFGGEHGIKLRQDTRAKNEWVIEGHEGGMVCKGRHGGLTGRPADLLLLDDMIKNTEEAVSKTIMDTAWDWYSTVAYSRLGPTAPVIAVGTRWGRRDLFGRIFDEARDTGEAWRVVKFPAIAFANDALGRKPGEALWPERVPLKRLERMQRSKGRWWLSCWQQEPEDEEGAYFRPRDWPRYTDIGDAFAVPDGHLRKVHLRTYTTVFVTVDWAISEKDTSDMTAFLVCGLTPDQKLLILEAVSQRFRMEQRASELSKLCRRWNPVLVAGEDDVLSTSMMLECRRFPNIPEIRRMPIGGKAKLVRALPAVTWGENGRIFLPRPPLDKVDGETTPWVGMYCDQLASFTGLGDAHDDLVDCTGLAAKVAEQLRTNRLDGQGAGPLVLTERQR